MIDFCLCHHDRAAHQDTFGPCLICTPPKGKPNQNRPFVCKPGACDRFTWDPEAEEVATHSRRKAAR